MRQMIAIGILFCLIFVNCFGGIDGVGEEADNGNGKKDLLFEEMWRKAVEANWHNAKEAEKKEMPKKVKEEQRETEENKLWKKVKREPIDDQLKEEEERDGEKWQKRIKKEPKNEVKEWENLLGKSEIKESDRNGLEKSHKKETTKGNLRKPKSEEEKWEIIEKFDKMRKESKMKWDYKFEDRLKIEREIAKGLGTFRERIFEWKKEQRQRNEPENEEINWGIVKEFNKMRNEYKKKKGYKNKNYCQIERKIARELGISRKNIYKWKKEQRQRKEPENKERKWKIIQKFNKMRNEYKMKTNFNRKNYTKIEHKIAKQLGTSRTSIYKWKKAFTPSRVTYTEEQKRAIIAKFDDLCEEFSNKFNRKTSKKIEEKIAKKFDICRNSIYMWKKAFEKNRT